MRGCAFASDKPDGRRYCRNAALCAPQLSRLVTAETCDSCTACNLTGEPTPAAQRLPPVKPKPSGRVIRPAPPPKPPECLHRSPEPHHHEPCSCGSASKVAVFKCEIHKRCVPLRTDLNRMKDNDARRACKCCEICSDVMTMVDLQAASGTD